jgi:hypothetical protein
MQFSVLGVSQKQRESAAFNGPRLHCSLSAHAAAGLGVNSPSLCAGFAHDWWREWKMDLDASIVTAVLDIKLLMDGEGHFVLLLIRICKPQNSETNHWRTSHQKHFQCSRLCKDKSALEMRNTNRSSSKFNLFLFFTSDPSVTGNKLIMYVNLS